MHLFKPVNAFSVNGFKYIRKQFFKRFYVGKICLSDRAKAAFPPTLKDRYKRYNLRASIV